MRAAHDKFAKDRRPVESHVEGSIASVNSFLVQVSHTVTARTRFRSLIDVDLITMVHA